MIRKALLVDYNLCDGCRLCVESCCREHDNLKGNSGIVLSQAGPYRFPSGKEETYYVITPTDFCDGCVKVGNPVCVSACPNQCLEFGDVLTLGGKLTGKKKALFVLSNRATMGEETK